MRRIVIYLPEDDQEIPASTLVKTIERIADVLEDEFDENGDYSRRRDIGQHGSANEAGDIILVAK